jgi:hypothetical protein
MQHIVLLTRNAGACVPRRASTIAPEVKLTFARDVIDVAIPLFTNKTPTNPDPDPDPDTGGGGTAT